jgi:hypothetical protein
LETYRSLSTTNMIYVPELFRIAQTFAESVEWSLRRCRRGGMQRREVLC